MFSKCMQCNFSDVSEIQSDMEDILVITFQLINYESSRSSSAIKFVCNGYLTLQESYCKNEYFIRHILLILHKTQYVISYHKITREMKTLYNLINILPNFL